jgi:hypothetical protein
MTATHDLGWCYWVLTAALLGAGLSVWPAGIFLALLWCSIEVVHVLWLTRDVTAFPVQIRVACLAMLMIGLREALQRIHWMQLAGTIVRISIDYWLLVRTLSLAPWNRRQPLSLALIGRTFFSLQGTMPPCGAVFRRIPLKQVQG